MFDRLKRRTRETLRETMRHATPALTHPVDTSDWPQIAYDPKLVPPLRLMRTEGIEVLEEWFRWGEEWSVLLRAFGGLRITSDVLEIGCGLGRIAFPLRYVLRDGTYRGSTSRNRRSISCNAISPQRIRAFNSNTRTCGTRSTTPPESSLLRVSASPTQTRSSTSCLPHPFLRTCFRMRALIISPKQAAC